ncbi:winged helix-turn-helix domain-containing protein [Brevundimonas lenta]|uniref:DNA-binding winged helix-turn-helix (WHTH) protein n=1 Tax=Brevundimonas lenta TaxID=424796 RepID=A0A7W6JDC3_9CAUL|nr:winged helix-turn-helix domain-containing protein [Brevundimonas lenta]MBB4083032.1 DNA-binding winged helix-turn-helix (wHTH) protein [Brevundimonas lenta]
MAPGGFRFERFHLDPRDRRLRRDDATVELNNRYLDALALLVSEQGRLVSKDRFLDEVWRGVPVTDEALTQCIRTLRRQLGDDAARPRFIETVPKHGYRFIAPVERIGDEPAAPAVPAAVGAPDWSRRQALVLGVAGMLGGGFAGAFGGLLYGFASAPGQSGAGASSVVLVLIFITILVGLIGGAGVGLGVGVSELAPGRRWAWSTLGGAVGGLLVGAFGKMLGLDAFTILLGQSPGEITGAGEGALLGGAIGFGAWLAVRGGALSLRRAMIAGGLSAAVAGVAIVLLGGRLMGGSLDLLARHFPNSRFRLDHLGALFGETGFGPVSQAVSAGIEGLLFGACVVGAMVLARRSMTSGNPG